MQKRICYDMLIVLQMILCLCMITGCSDEKESVSKSTVKATAKATVKEKETDTVKEKDRSDFVVVSDIVPDAILEIRYYTSYNFVGERIDSYNEPIAILTKEAAKALKKASDMFIKEGYRIKIYDAYRPQTAVNHFKRWAEDIDDTKMKKHFYPDVDKAKLFELGFIAAKSGHSRGSTVDLTLVNMTSGEDIDVGCHFDYFGEISHHDSNKVNDTQKKNRKLIKSIMEKNGFNSYAEEWWHYTLDNEPFKDTYFDFPVEDF